MTQSRRSSAELTRSLGASLVINTREQDVVERVMDWTDGRGVDVVIDNLGGDVLAKSLDAVRVGSIAICIGPGWHLEQPNPLSLRCHQS